MAEKKIKIKRPKAITPKGFKDYFVNDVLKRQDLIKTICEAYELFGFEILESSAVETVEALGKYLPDVDRPNQGIFSWQDEENEWLALRYDLTAPLARVYAQYRNNLPAPYRRYSFGPVWRNEKPGPGRYKQFYQCDADTVGAYSPVADAEMCTMLGFVLKAIGIPKDQYTINLNNRKILNGVMEEIGILNNVEPEVNKLTRGTVLRSIDKIDRLGHLGVRELLGFGRKDDSGDITEGAGLSKGQIDHIMSFVSLNEDSNKKTLGELSHLVGKSSIGNTGIKELELIVELTDAGDLVDDLVRINPGTVRGLGYYTGAVFEAELKVKYINPDGAESEIGSVAGGGRYDDLIKRFTGQEVPATGLSIGVDRLGFAIAQLNKAPKSYNHGPVLVTILDKEKILDYQEIVSELRSSGIRAELFLGNPKDLGKQLKYADQRNSRLAIVAGSNEFEKGNVQVKDLELGAKISSTVKTNEEWKGQPAQIEISRKDLVKHIQKFLSS